MREKPKRQSERCRFIYLVVGLRLTDRIDLYARVRVQLYKTLVLIFILRNFLRKNENVANYFFLQFFQFFLKRMVNECYIESFLKSIINLYFKEKKKKTITHFFKVVTIKALKYAFGLTYLLIQIIFIRVGCKAYLFSSHQCNMYTISNVYGQRILSNICRNNCTTRIRRSFRQILVFFFFNEQQIFVFF